MRVADYRPGLIVNSNDAATITGRRLPPATTIGDCWIVGQTYFCKVQDPRGAIHVRALPRLEIKEVAV